MSFNLNDGNGYWRYLGKWIRPSESSSDWHARILVNDSVIAVVSSVNNSVSTHYLIQDALGSTVAVTDETGTTTTRIAYDAWGNLVQPDDGTTQVDPTTISNLTTVGYTGGELIAEANLVQMGARLYDPASGVFLNPDPTNSLPYASQGWNQYAYVLDNPLRYTDPSGLVAKNIESPQPWEWQSETMGNLSFAMMPNGGYEDAELQWNEAWQRRLGIMAHFLDSGSLGIVDLVAVEYRSTADQAAAFINAEIMSGTLLAYNDLPNAMVAAANIGNMQNVHEMADAEGAYRNNPIWQTLGQIR